MLPMTSAATARLSRVQRLIAFVLTIFVGATAAVYLPATPAQAAPCSVEEWGVDPGRCAKELPDIVDARKQCLNPPIPASPYEGMGGWFATKPASAGKTGLGGIYSDTGYAGFDFIVYDVGCTGPLTSPANDITSAIAGWTMSLATGILGASNALREKAWSPGSLWGWADPLVERATKSIYQKVFTVFGILTLALVGLWLLWRARNANASQTVTIAGWALFVMVLVTAIARWPVASANLADDALTNTVTTVATAIGPGEEKVDPKDCVLGPEACQDHRDPSVRAADTTVDTILYRNWLRGVLGSADSTTAKKYGWSLHRATSMTWGEAERAEQPHLRKQLIEFKQEDWKKIGEQIREEDPGAYAYMTGQRGSDRIGASFIALLSAIIFAAFDMTSSLLILLGFLIIRWAVIAAPAIGTVALLKPAASGLKRLGNTVVGSLISVVIFSIGGPAYLSATSLILSEKSLAGWLQMVLVLVCGIAGWTLLRPYRRMRALAGNDPILAMRGMQDEMTRELRKQNRRWRRRSRRSQRAAKGAEDAAESTEDLLLEDLLGGQRPEAHEENVFGGRGRMRVPATIFTRYESSPDPRAGALDMRPHRDETPAIGAAGGGIGPGFDGTEILGDRQVRGDTLVIDAEIVEDFGDHSRASQESSTPPRMDIIDAEIVESPAGDEPQRVWRPGAGYEVLPTQHRHSIEAAPPDAGGQQSRVTGLTEEVDL